MAVLSPTCMVWFLVSFGLFCELKVVLPKYQNHLILNYLSKMPEQNYLISPLFKDLRFLFVSLELN